MERLDQSVLRMEGRALITQSGWAFNLFVVFNMGVCFVVA